MPRGTGMSPTRRRGRRPKADSPEALAARLPVELRSRAGLDSIDAYKSRATAVADWLNTQIPGQGRELLPSVMAAAGVGLSIVDFYRYRLTGEQPHAT